jgi:putative addiction module component (TIGR02574 family)
LESLDGPDEDGEEAWAQEIERRCRALDNGEASTASWEEFRARIERDIFGPLNKAVQLSSFAQTEIDHYIRRYQLQSSGLAHMSRRPTYWRSRLSNE